MSNLTPDPNIDSLAFDATRWQSVERQPYRKVWADNVKSLSSVLSLEFFSMPPDIPVPLANINGIRFIYRTLANQSGAGLISAEVVDIQGIGCVETVFKMPQEGRGMVYIGSITVPFAELSYVIKIQALELGHFSGSNEFIGKREAAIIDRLLSAGAQIDAATGKLIGWSHDPYDTDQEYPLMPNLAEAEKYDEEFADHALSKVRDTLAVVKRTMRLHEELLLLKPFTATT